MFGVRRKVKPGRDVEVTNLLRCAFFKQLTYPEVANNSCGFLSTYFGSEPLGFFVGQFLEINPWNVQRPLPCLKLTFSPLKKGCLEYYFPIGEAYFQGRKAVRFREGMWMYVDFTTAQHLEFHHQNGFA